MASQPTAPRTFATRLRALALASVALCGAGCSFAMVRPYPREGTGNSRLAAPAAPEPEPPPEEEAPPRNRGATYVSAWVGHGGGASYRADGSTWFQTAPFIWLPVPLAAGLGFGKPVGSRLQLGLEWNVLLGVNCVGSMSTSGGECDRSTFIQQFAAMATWYPWWDGPPERLPGGLFVRGGPALALFRSSYLGGQDPWDPPLPASQTALWTRTGVGLLAGVGVSAPIGRRARSLEGGLDFAWQRYGASATLPERSWWMVVRGGLTFH